MIAQLSSLSDILNRGFGQKANIIATDTGNKEFKLLPSGQRYGLPRPRWTRFKHLFLERAMNLLDLQSRNTFSPFALTKKNLIVLVVVIVFHWFLLASFTRCVSFHTYCFIFIFYHDSIWLFLNYIPSLQLWFIFFEFYWWMSLVWWVCFRHPAKPNFPCDTNYVSKAFDWMTCLLKKTFTMEVESLRHGPGSNNLF